MNTNHKTHFLLFGRLPIQRGLAFGAMIVVALLFFEMFNYSTTDFALHDLLGDLTFLGLRWSTILALAFCGIDFAGIARIFTPEEGANEPAEVWYLFGAWLLAATMNAMLTWWGVSIALLNRGAIGNELVSQQTLLRLVPIFVAMLVWLSRVLLIGTFSVAGERLFTQSAASRSRLPQLTQTAQAARSNGTANLSRHPARQPVRSFSSSARPEPLVERYPAPEARQGPSYHPVQMAGRQTAQEQRTKGSR